MAKPKLDLTNEDATNYSCPNCATKLTVQPLAIKQPLLLIGRCPNDTCFLVRIKMLRVG